MVIYFAGQGHHIENNERIYAEPNWGVLLTYKDMVPKVKGNVRYQKLKKKYRQILKQKRQNGNK